MFSKKIYIGFYGLFAVVYAFGLLVPLMNNDSAHHANIGLHMFLTGDYVSLIDHGRDYLDKPHFLFWIATVGYRLVGVTTLGFKLPSFLFSILAIYSTYRLGRILYNNETGKLAALLVTSMLAFILGNNDVRMDAILTACTIFSIWQFVEFTEGNRWSNLTLAALGLAIGFSTKGLIGAFLPCFAIVLHLVYQQKWKTLFSWKWLAAFAMFMLFITPVLVCYYLQFDLHPEKVIRGNSGISGVKFILWSQNFERLEGTAFGGAGKSDPFFFLHTMLWTCLPWSLLVVVGFWKKYKQLVQDKFKFNPGNEILTIGTITFFLLIVSFAGFKLPHYINILLPLFSIIVAGIITTSFDLKKLKGIRITQWIVVSIMLLLTITINLWAFPIHSLWIAAGIVALIGVYYGLQKNLSGVSAIIALSLFASVLTNYLLNSNFYPQLLQYQAGNVLATKVGVNKDKVYYLKGPEYNNSFDFYTGRIVPTVDIDSLAALPKNSILYVGEKGLNELRSKSIAYTPLDSTWNFRVTRITGSFLNPATREKKLKKHYLLQLAN